MTTKNKINSLYKCFASNNNCVDCEFKSSCAMLDTALYNEKLNKELVRLKKENAEKQERIIALANNCETLNANKDAYKKEVEQAFQNGRVKGCDETLSYEQKKVEELKKRMCPNIHYSVNHNPCEACIYCDAINKVFGLDKKV